MEDYLVDVLPPDAGIKIAEWYDKKGADYQYTAHLNQTMILP